MKTDNEVCGFGRSPGNDGGLGPGGERTGDRPEHPAHRGAGDPGVLPRDAGIDPRDVRGRDAGPVALRSPGAGGGPGPGLRSSGEKRREGNKGDQVDADQLSELLRRGGLRAVYHGSAAPLDAEGADADLPERGGGLDPGDAPTQGAVQGPGDQGAGQAASTTRRTGQEWLAKLSDDGARFRAQTLYAQLDVLRELRPKAKAAMVAEARRDPAWAVLGSIPFLGPVRIALILAIMRTPWRFRTKRNLWAYCGLAVVTHSSAEYDPGGRPASEAAPRAHDPWAQSQLQPGTQGRLQGCSHGGHRTAGPVAGLLRGNDRSGDAGGTGTRDADPETRGPHTPALENRRTLRSNEADQASALAPGPTRPR